MHRLRRGSPPSRDSVRGHRATAVALALFLLLVGVAGRSVAGAATPTSTAPPAAAAGSDWTVYHGDQTGSGVAPGTGQVVTSAPAWTSPALDGQLYGEPLVSSGRRLRGDRERHRRTRSTADRRGRVVDDISPTPFRHRSSRAGTSQPDCGITGTPVIDPSRDEIFVVADEIVKRCAGPPARRTQHDVRKVQLTENVDPPGADPAGAVAAHGARPRRRTRRLRLGWQLRRLRDVPRLGRRGAETGRDARPLRGRQPGRRDAKAPSGWAARRRSSTPPATCG